VRTEWSYLKEDLGYHQPTVRKLAPGLVPLSGRIEGKSSQEGEKLVVLAYDPGAQFTKSLRCCAKAAVSNEREGFGYARARERHAGLWLGPQDAAAKFR
jgi:hypothetical protein